MSRTHFESLRRIGRMAASTEARLVEVAKRKSRIRGLLPSNRYWRYASLGIVLAPLLFIVLATAQFLQASDVQFSYSSRNCFSKPVLFPGNGTLAESETFVVYPEDTVSLGPVRLFSRTACVAPQLANSDINISETVSIKSLGLLGSKIQISHSSALPSARVGQAEVISPSAPLEFELDEANIYFDYLLEANESATECTVGLESISCPLDKLDLQYNSTYDAALLSGPSYGSKRELSTLQITTTDPLQLTESSIELDATVYDNPESLSFTFNYPVESAGSSELQHDGQKDPVELTTEAIENTVTVSLPASLARNQQYTLTLLNLTGAEGTGLDSLDFTFNTAGSPRVTALSAPDYGASPYNDVVIYFDYDLLQEQNAEQLVSLSSNGVELPFSASISDSKITVNPAAQLPNCKNVTVSVAKGLQNSHGTSDATTSYSGSFKTSCASVGSIGTSAEGRPITVYTFGEGDKVALYYGALHGNELSSKYILDAWVQELEQNPELIPKGVKVHIVPNVNPDGVVRNSRYNANGVDLNRNFDTDDWKSDVTVPGGALRIGGGGPSPLSEPESQAIANFTVSSGADIVVYYHAVANTTIANGTASSYGFAAQYAALSGYPDESYTETSAIFSYDIVGTYGDWSRDRGVAGVLIELRTIAGNEFSANRSAMIKMLELL